MKKSGVVRYEGYKSIVKGKGSKNKRKNKLASQRKEEMAIIKLRKLVAERQANLEKVKYAKEAREWESRFDYL